MIDQVAARDARDKHNTIICDDAVVIDGTSLSQADVLAEAIRIIDAKLALLKAG